MPSARLSSPIRLVCFDLGGVLLRICRSWDEACGRAGVPVRDRGLQGEAMSERERAVIDYQTGRTSRDAFARALSDVFGGAYSPDEVKRVHAAWVIDEYEGVCDVIDAIHAAGLPTACLSNTNETHWRQIVAYPSVMRLGTRLASHELGLHKPDPAIYREAERLLAAPPHGILFFDDLEPNILAAREAGWHAVRIDHAACTATQIRSALREHGAGGV
jgi:FMN phosphatase YigB (HAD superfamily)